MPKSKPAIAAQYWMPFEFAGVVAQRSLSDFEGEFSGLFFLLVRLSEPSGPLAVALQRTSTLVGSGAATSDEISQTTIYCSTREFATASDAAGHITAEMLAEPRFVVPIRRRKEQEGEARERIWVGRGQNNDIVLRHRTVSKTHGWFSYDPENRLFVQDAKSRNATRVNGETLEADRVELRAGDRVRFGWVEAMIVSPDALWHALARV